MVFFAYGKMHLAFSLKVAICPAKHKYTHSYRNFFRTLVAKTNRMSQILGVIPARYASTRFPGKPLADILGQSMIERVYRQCLKATRLSEVVVATDDKRIFDHVKGFGGKVEMTRSDHVSGTERVAEIAGKYPSFTHFVNIQGDEPFIDPAQIELLCTTLTQSPKVVLATLVKQFTDPELLLSTHTVKVVLDEMGSALYFSRAPIPHCRDCTTAAKALEQHPYYQHIGIYGFEREVLLKIPRMRATQIERIESLEQLRWLAHGHRIHVAVTESSAQGVDTPEDLEKLVKKLQSQ